MEIYILRSFHGCRMDKQRHIQSTLEMTSLFKLAFAGGGVEGQIVFSAEWSKSDKYSLEKHARGNPNSQWRNYQRTMVRSRNSFLFRTIYEAVSKENLSKAFQSLPLILVRAERFELMKYFLAFAIKDHRNSAFLMECNRGTRLCITLLLVGVKWVHIHLGELFRSLLEELRSHHNFILDVAPV